MDYKVASVDTALSLLSLVGECPGLGVTELSQRAGLNKSRAFRLLATLEMHRWVVREGDPVTYVLGPQALVLGVAAHEQVNLVKIAHRHMQTLGRALNENIQLRVRDGLESLCVARVESTHELRMHGVVGNRRPLYVGASGKVLLAFSADDVRAQVLGRPRRRFTSGTLTERDELFTELGNVRSKDCAVSFGELTPEAVSVAVPVRDATGEVVAALSASGPSSRMTRALLPDIAARLSACAVAISAGLGYQEAPLDAQDAA
ncbi:IclR family transcriptional regulator [Pandoraea terrae]|uniref:IclR family transcriptional regulator n=1 Tax=Pandoraea terrae TaxID=1537710 RepID=A0A5E4YDV0_9BURK|nr:IclR family transcriptional regulator [Pandoraea terrae]VVE46607.1 IclR family transcriptional regulator [Pandoraea terrae]